MFKRRYIKKPYASIRTDAGSEFKNGIFKKWMYDNSILHKIAEPERHKQLANVENLNKTLGRLFNGYMNFKEEESGGEYREWTDILDTVRKRLNDIRRIPEGDIFTDVYQPIDIKPERFKVGDIVYRKSEP